MPTQASPTPRTSSPKRSGARPRLRLRNADAATLAPPRKAAAVTLDAAMHPAQAFAAIAHACTQQLAANAPGALSPASAEYVHQMRVALRRLRSAIRLFRTHLPPDFTEHIIPELRWLTGVLGRVRDRDVLLEETLPRLLRKPAQTRAGTHERAIAASIAKERDVAVRAMQRALRSRRYNALLRDMADACLRLQHLPTVGADVGLRKFAMHELHRLEKKMRVKAGKLTQMEAEERHQLRIHGKRLRYAVDFFASLFKVKAARHYAKQLAQLQGALGMLNDGAVALTLLPAQALPPRTLALVQSRLQMQAEEGLEAAVHAYAKFARCKTYWDKS